MIPPVFGFHELLRFFEGGFINQRFINNLDLDYFVRAPLDLWPIGLPAVRSDYFFTASFFSIAAVADINFIFQQICDCPVLESGSSFKLTIVSDAFIAKHIEEHLNFRGIFGVIEPFFLPIV